MSSGGLHSAVLNDEGNVWIWGCNDEGALGTGNNYSIKLFNQLSDIIRDGEKCYGARGSGSK